MAIDVRSPYPEPPPRDYTGTAVHLFECGWCGQQAAVRTAEPFGLVRARSYITKALGWHRLPIREDEQQQFVCSNVCAAYHPRFKS